VGVLVFMAWLLALGTFARRTGGAFLLGIALWAAARAAVASTWRDPVVVGPLRMEQVVSLGLAAGALVLLALVTAVDVVRRRRGGGAPADGPRAGTRDVPADASEPAWPDPTSRPRI
jgi:hypothetical protein